MGKLHLYAQHSWHEDAFIAGDREALTALRDALSRVLDGPQPADAIDAYPEDGECYTLLVVRLDDAKAWEKLHLPYAAIRSERHDGEYPCHAIDNDLYDQIRARRR